LCDGLLTKSTMRKSARLAQSRVTTAPRPDALSAFLDQHDMMTAAFAPKIMSPPEFRPSATAGGGSGGGFGTGGGFGSTGGFHTTRLAPWEEPRTIVLEDPEPEPVGTLSRWAPSVCASEMANHVNRIRAEMTGKLEYKAVVRDLQGEDSQAEVHGDAALMVQPERFEFFKVKVPPAKTVLPPDAWYKQDELLSAKERESILQYEKQKRMADTIKAKDKHKQMRLIALMQKRFPSGVIGVESADCPDTIVYAADRMAANVKREQRDSRRSQRREWLVQNSYSEPHLGYDFMTQVDPNVQPPAGLERRLWASKKRIPSEVKELVNPSNTYSRVFQDAGIDYSRSQPEVMFNERTKNLRNRETNGKKFNIITGALYEYCNPSMDEKKPSGISTVDTRSREIHPSLNPGPPPAHLTWADS